MGGTTFETFQPATSHITTPQEAFAKAVRDAAHEYGHGGYTGTIAEKPGFRMARREPVSRLEADKIMEATLDTDFNDKWGDAGCLAIADVPTKERTITRTITVTHENGVHPTDADLVAALKLEPGETITKVRIVSDDRKYRTRTKRHTGKAERVFVVSNGQRDTSEFGSLAEAVAAVESHRQRVVDHAMKSANDRPEWGWANAAATVDIVEVVRRGGLAAATVTTELTSRRLKVEVETSRPVGKAGKVTGWLFYGWASC